MPLDQVFLEQFSQHVGLPFVVNILASMTWDGAKKLVNWRSGKKSADQAELLNKVRELKRNANWIQLIADAWTQAIRSASVSDNELVIALSDPLFIDNVFADLKSERLTGDFVQRVLAEREKNSNLAEIREDDIKELASLLYREFLVVVSKDELLRFLYVAAQNEKIFDRLIRIEALGREQFVVIIGDLLAIQRSLNSLLAAYFQDSVQTKDILFEILNLLKVCLQERRPLDAQEILLDAYVASILRNEEEFIWQDAVYVPLEVQPKTRRVADEKFKCGVPSVDAFLQTARKYERPSRPGEDEERRERSVPVPLQDAVKEYPKLVMLGEPGAGKSISLRHLVVKLARERKENPDSPIPVFIELRGIGLDGKNLSSLVAKQLSCDVNSLEQLLESNKFVFFFDGLNEIAFEHRRDGLESVRQFFDGKHRCYATSRLVGYSDDIPTETVQIEPLDEERIRQFIANYLPTLNSDRTESEIHSAIENEPRLMELASNPLMLMMMTTVLALPEYPDMPKSRGQLFQRFVKHIHERDCERGMCKLEEAHWTHLLGALAYEMIDAGGKVSIENIRAMEILKKARDGLIDSGRLSSHKHGELRDAYDELCHSGFLRDKGDSVEFWHQLFQEYFAACRLKEFGMEELLRNVNSFVEYYRWDEVIFNLMGILQAKDAAEFLIEISRWDIFLAAKSFRFVSEKTEKSESLVDELMEWADDADANVRARAADLLGQTESERTMDKLIGLLNDSDVFVHRTAANVLRKIKSERAVDALIGLLSNSDDHVRWGATYDLGKVKSERAVDKLISLLSDPKDFVRGGATFALGQIKSERVVEKLISLLSDPNDLVRESAAFALGKVESERAVDGLIGLLSDSNHSVRRRAADALGKIKSLQAADALIGLLSDSNDDVREGVANALGEIESKCAVDGLIGLLRDSNYVVRMSAVDALGKINSKRAADALIGLLTDPDFNVRWRVADALGRTKSEPVVAKLIGLLSDSDGDVRWGAVYALGQIKSERAVDSLIGLLSDSNSYVREAVADALGEVKSERALDALIDLLTDSDFNVRWRAAFALGKIKSSRAVDRLISLLDGCDRASAAYALGEIRSEGAVDKLIGLLSDPDAGVRGIAADALGQIKSDRAEDALIGLLNDADASVRRSAACALGEIKSDRAMDALISLLDDADEEVRWGTEYALGKIAEGIETDCQIEMTKKLKKRFAQLGAGDKKRDCAAAISNLKDAAKRRFLDVFGPNFGFNA